MPVKASDLLCGLIWFNLMRFKNNTLKVWKHTSVKRRKQGSLKSFSYQLSKIIEKLNNLKLIKLTEYEIILERKEGSIGSLISLCYQLTI